MIFMKMNQNLANCVGVSVGQLTRCWHFSPVSKIGWNVSTTTLNKLKLKLVYWAPLVGGAEKTLPFSSHCRLWQHIFSRNLDSLCCTVIMRKGVSQQNNIRPGVVLPLHPLSQQHRSYKNKSSSWHCTIKNKINVLPLFCIAVVFFLLFIEQLGSGTHCRHVQKLRTW